MLKNILLFCGYKIIKIRKQPERLNQIDSTITTTKIHYACGKNFFNGWLNVDLNKNINNEIFLVDLVKRHPFSNNLFEWGFGEDFIEHLHQADSLIFLAEVYRTFKSGGVCRLAFPSMDGQVKEGPPFSDYDSAIKIKENYYDKWNHVHLYSKDEFKKVCKHIGFREVEFKSYHESDHDILSGLESREEVRNYYIYVEITK